MNSRERMLTAIDRGTPDHVPLSFMIFSALRARSDGWRDFAERSLELGIDPVVDLWCAASGGGAEHSDCAGTPVHFAPGVTVREWRERVEDERYPLLHKEYHTPCGMLTTTVRQTDDWPYGDHVPFLNDYVEPRALKHLVKSSDDLDALQHLLADPCGDDMELHRAGWKEATAFARERGLLTAAGWGVGADALAWLCGLTNSVMSAVDRPEFIEDVLSVIHRWNLRRMELMLEPKPDLFIRRGWYEGTSFWSPALYRRLILPGLKREVELAHRVGSRFGYILTVGANQFTDLLLEAGVDVILGVEDVQDHGMRFAELKAKVKGRAALWGGVNGFLHVEEGSERDIDAAVQAALATLGPDGFILSPVDNIRNPGEVVWRKVLHLIEAWKRQS